MKSNSFRNMVILIAVLIVFCSCQQKQNTGTDKTNPSGSVDYRLFKLYYKNTSGENGISVYDYDQAGHRRKGIWYSLDGSRNSLNHYTCDSNGNTIKLFREFSDSLTSEEEFMFDHDGRMLKATFRRSDGRNGVTTYEYDNDGRLIRANCDGWKGWFYGTIDYRYDDAGRKVEGEISQKGEPAGMITYSYDDHGTLETEHWAFTGGWSQTFRYEYQLWEPDRITEPWTSPSAFINNSGTFRLVGEYYDYGGEFGGPSCFRYDESGKLVEKRFDRSDDFFTITTYLYDLCGKVAASYRTYSNGLTAVFAYEYNPARQLTKRTFMRTDGNRGSERYEYDDQSKLVRAVYKNFDSWLSGTISFSHTDENLPSSGHFKGDDGFDAEIAFDYDHNHNLVQMRWDFSFSKSQTYWFEYEQL